MTEIKLGEDAVVRVWRDGPWIIVYTKAGGSETTVSLTPEQFAKISETSL